MLKKKYHLDFVLKIIGPGDKKDLELKAEKLGIGSQVEFLGKILNQPLENAYVHSDLLLNTSVIEGFSTVLLEAMAKGLPIVASNVIGTRSVIKDEYNGLLTSLSVTKMSNAIHRLIHSPTLYQKISRNNLKEITKYNWDENLRRVIQVYHDCQKFR